MRSKDRFPEKFRFQILGYLIVGPLTALAYYFFGVEGATTFMALLAYGGGALLFLSLVCMFWPSKQIRENKVHAAQWKQRI